MVKTVNCYQMVHRNAFINEHKNILQTKLYEHLHILQNFIFFMEVSPKWILAPITFLISHQEESSQVIFVYAKIKQTQIISGSPRNENAAMGHPKWGP